MKLWNREPPLVGSLYLRPDAVSWLLARDVAGTPELTAVGVTPVSGGPAAQAELDAALARSPVTWSLVVPVVARAALMELPPLNESELARGLGWQAERAFHLAAGTATVDYEPQPAALAADSEGATTSQSALVVAVTETDLSDWLARVRQLPIRPSRLEPVAPAILRSQRRLVSPGPATVWLHQDSTGADLAIFWRGAPLTFRHLMRASTDHPPLLAGEAGMIRVRETLLSCEDRYPELGLELLIGSGDIEREWLEECASSTGLSLAPTPNPPGSHAVELGTDADWLIPYGGLLGT